MKSLVNFRDVGGFATADGTSVKKGQIFRSGEIVNLTPDDKAAFQNEYNIKTIFDLRGKEEIKEQPDDTFEGVSYVNIDIMKDSQGHSSSLDDMTNAPVSSDDQMRQIYRDIILTQSGRHGYQEFLEKVVTDEEPFIFHCFAGKDRTGIAAALILGMLNVSKKDIYDDYLKTNKMRKRANDGIVSQLREQGMPEKDIEEVKVMMSVKKEYLDIAFATVKEHYGDLSNYIVSDDGLALPNSLITDMKKLYTQ